MNDQIFETVVTTVAPDGTPHVAPMGVRYRDAHVVLMPFKPSTTLDNILATRHAVLNLVTDTRVSVTRFSTAWRVARMLSSVVEGLKGISTTWASR